MLNPEKLTEKLLKVKEKRMKYRKEEYETIFATRMDLERKTTYSTCKISSIQKCKGILKEVGE